MKKAKDAIFGGALALQSTNLLKDRSTAGLTSSMEGFVGIGVTGAMSNVAYDMVSMPKYKKKRRK